MTTVDLSRAVWRKSRRSHQNGECVEVAALMGTVAVRDSKSPDGPVLTLTDATWRTLTTHIRSGGHDL